MKEILQEISFWYWLFGILLIILLFLRKTLVFIWKTIQREWRLHKGLSRPIMIVIPKEEERGNSENMKEERKLMKNSGIFNTSEDDYYASESFEVENHSLIILGYCKGMKNIDQVVNAAKDKKIPLIVYTFRKYIDRDDPNKELIDNYKYSVLSITPLSLLNNIFSTLITYKYK